MRRSSDRPRTVVENVTATKQAIEEVARRQGRGATALRNYVGHLLELNPNSTRPYVTPVGYDSGIEFTHNGVIARAEDGTLRNLDCADANLREVWADGGLYATGGITGHGIVCNGVLTQNGQINAGTNPIYVGDVHGQALYGWGVDTTALTVRGGSNMGTISCGQINMGLAQIYMGDLHAQTVFYTGLVNASDPGAKKDIRNPRAVLGKSLLQAVRDAPVSVYRFREDVPAVANQAGKDKIGLMATEVPAIARATYRGPRHEDAEGNEVVPEVPGVDTASMVSILWGAVRDLADELDAAKARITALENRGPAGPPG